MTGEDASAYEREWTVRFSDVDPFGIAHYPRIVDAVHETSDEFMESIGWPFWELSLDHGFGLPIVEVDLEFESPVEAGDRVTIALHVDPGDQSVRYDYVARVDGEVAFTGFEQRVCVDKERIEPMPIPADLRAALAAAVEE